MLLTIVGCWFTSDRTRLLVNFLPRWIIIVLMLLLYARLHFVLHRAHNNFMSFDEEDPYGSGSHGNTLTSATPRVQSVNLVKMSDNASDQDRILPPTPPKPRPRRARGSSDLKRLSYQMMMYPLVYGIIWALPTSIRIYQAVSNNSAGFAISTVDKVRINNRQTLLPQPVNKYIVMHRHPGLLRCHRLRLQRKDVARLEGALPRQKVKLNDRLQPSSHVLSPAYSNHVTFSLLALSHV